MLTGLLWETAEHQPCCRVGKIRQTGIAGLKKQQIHSVESNCECFDELHNSVELIEIVLRVRTRHQEKEDTWVSMFLLAVSKRKVSDECRIGRNTNGFGFSGSSSRQRLSSIWQSCWTLLSRSNRTQLTGFPVSFFLFPDCVTVQTVYMAAPIEGILVRILLNVGPIDSCADTFEVRGRDSAIIPQ